jgi:glycosyltransferase involved in cell wall biosynthesis
MNILIIVSSLNVGGAEKQAIHDANMLCDKNSIHLMVFDGDGNNSFLKSHLAANVTFVVVKKSGYLKTSKRVAQYIVKNKIGIIHSSLFAPMIIGAIASFKTKTPIFWTFHSHEYDIPLKSKAAIVLLARINELKSIFYVNHELKDYFENRLWLPLNKSKVLYNSTALLAVRKNDDKLNDHKLSIGYVGRLVELKRVYILLELASFLKENGLFNFRIDIYGDGESKQELQDMSRENELDDVVVFHGFKTDLEYAYHSFDLFINPSQEECLSVATIDAGITGNPIIVFDVGGNDEIVIHDKTGFVVNSKEDLFRYTFLLLIDSSKRLEFGVNAIEHCKSNFTEETRKNNLTQYFLSVDKK